MTNYILLTRSIGQNRSRCASVSSGERGRGMEVYRQHILGGLLSLLVNTWECKTHRFVKAKPDFECVTVGSIRIEAVQMQEVACQPFLHKLQQDTPTSGSRLFQSVHIKKK